MAASHAPWSTQENKALIAAFEDHGNKWKDVAKAVGSRTWQQCRRQHGNLKRNGRLVPISKTTPLVHKLLPGLYEGAFNRCVAEIDGKRITTVGQLAALDLDISKEENKLYLKKLTGKSPTAAVEMAAKWKAKAIEAIAFWQ